MAYFDMVSFLGVGKLFVVILNVVIMAAADLSDDKLVAIMAGADLSTIRPAVDAARGRPNPVATLLVGAIDSASPPLPASETAGAIENPSPALPAAAADSRMLLTMQTWFVDDGAAAVASDVDASSTVPPAVASFLPVMATGSDDRWAAIVGPLIGVRPLTTVLTASDITEVVTATATLWRGGGKTESGGTNGAELAIG